VGSTSASRVLEPCGSAGQRLLCVGAVRWRTVGLERINSQRGSLIYARIHRRTAAFESRLIARGPLHDFDVAHSRVGVFIAGDAVVAESNISLPIAALAAVRSIMRAGFSVCMLCGSWGISFGTVKSAKVSSLRAVQFVA
jgi:hypothetical protein